MGDTNQIPSISRFVAPTTSSRFVAPTTSSRFVAPTAPSRFVAPTSVVSSRFVAPTPQSSHIEDDIIKVTTYRQARTNRRFTPKPKAEMIEEVDPVKELQDYLADYDYDDIITNISTSKFKNGTPILDVQHTEIIKEIAAMIIEDPNGVVNKLTNMIDHNSVIWDQSIMDESKAKVEAEVALYRRTKKGIKGIRKCIFCGHDELVIGEKQTSAGDEGMTVFYECVKCGRKFRSK